MIGLHVRYETGIHTEHKCKNCDCKAGNVSLQSLKGSEKVKKQPCKGRNTQPINRIFFREHPEYKQGSDNPQQGDGNYIKYRNGFFLCHGPPVRRYRHDIPGRKNHKKRDYRKEIVGILGFGN